MGSLAEIEPHRGLPRGRASLPPDEIAHAQRERMLRAIIGAAAELGYANVRIADVVDRARVSRQSFYARFADKQECFLAAHAEGIEIIIARLAESAAERPDVDARGALRSALRAYLSLASAEPEFAQCMLVELQAIGPAGLAARVAAHDAIAALMRSWHAAARSAERSWPSVPVSRYAAAVGAVHDLLFAAVAAGRADDPAALERDALDAVLTLLEIPA